MKNILGAFLFFAGLVAMAGSANDCDGACMSQANTMVEMLTFAGLGLAFFVCGGAILISNSKEVA